MAERVSVPYSDAKPEIHDPLAAQTEPTFESGTYVVQVPKDQIYRVPPPENALIARRHLNPEAKKHRPCCSCFWCCLITVAIAAVAIALSIGLSFAFLKPRNPQFQVRNLIVRNQLSHGNHSQPEYGITLRVDNPNGRSDILYKQDGVTSLLFKQQKIATGKFPAFHQETKNSTQIGIALNGSGIALPKDIENSIRNGLSKVHVPLSLEINVPVRMKVDSFKTGNANLVVICDFEVDTLAAGTHIRSQECQTNR